MGSQNTTQQNKCLSWLEKHLSLAVRVTDCFPTKFLGRQHHLAAIIQPPGSKHFEDNSASETAAHLRNPRCLMRLRASVSSISTHSELRHSYKTTLFFLSQDNFPTCLNRTNPSSTPWHKSKQVKLCWDAHRQWLKFVFKLEHNSAIQQLDF